MKAFVWAVVLLGFGFFLARLYRKSTTLIAPSPPAFTEGRGTSVDYK